MIATMQSNDVGDSIDGRYVAHNTFEEHFANKVVLLLLAVLLICLLLLVARCCQYCIFDEKYKTEQDSSGTKCKSLKATRFGRVKN